MFGGLTIALVLLALIHDVCWCAWLPPVLWNGRSLLPAYVELLPWMLPGRTNVSVGGASNAGRVGSLSVTLSWRVARARKAGFPDKQWCRGRLQVGESSR